MGDEWCIGMRTACTVSRMVGMAGDVMGKSAAPTEALTCRGVRSSDRRACADFLFLATPSKASRDPTERE